MTAVPLLLVADHVGGSLSLLTLPDGEVVTRLDRRHPSEHAGFLALPGGRVACVDDRAGALLVLDPFTAGPEQPLVRAEIPVAVPAEHLAADPEGQRVAVTTGLGCHDTPWSDLLTVADLHTGDAVRVRVRVGEPGVTLLGGPDPMVVLRQREPGALTAHRYAELLAAPPGCPPAPPALCTLPLPDDGHGDAQDPLHRRVFAATGGGVHRARRSGDTLVAEAALPWGAEGRGYFLRLDPRRRLLWSCLRGGPADPRRWPEWTNTAWCHRLDEGSTELVDLGPGLVFRMGLTRRHAAFARVHPDGDELVLLDVDGRGPAVTRRLPLPPMDGAPRAGGTPWEGVQRRAVAASPGASWVAVSRGGHGEIHLVDAENPDDSRVLEAGSALDHGGHLALLAPGDDAHHDPLGR
ncbi:YncE family protein [Streptomyces sparsus]